MRRILAAAFWLGLAWPIAGCDTGPQATIERLAPGVFARVLPEGRGPTSRGANQGWVVFEDYVVVVDPGYVRPAKELLAEIRARSDKPIRYVFVTHPHPDHSAGAAVFAAEGAAVVAAHGSEEFYEVWARNFFAGQVKAKPDMYAGLAYSPPSVYFDQAFVIEDETQRLELIHFGHGHTSSDAVAWLPQHGVIFTGDLCDNGPYANLAQADTAGWVRALEAIEALPVERVVPGHGPLADRGVLALQRRTLAELRAAVREMLAAGDSFESVRANIDLPFYRDWTGISVAESGKALEFLYVELGGIIPEEKPIPRRVVAVAGLTVLVALVGLGASLLWWRRRNR